MSVADCVNCGGLVDPGSGWSPQVVGAETVWLWVMFVRIVREKHDANECA
jgi:hypothetical protein